MNVNNQLNEKDYEFLEAKIEWIQLNYFSLLHLVTSGGQYTKTWRPEMGKFTDYLKCIGCEEIFGEFIKIIESLNKNCDPDQSVLTDQTDLDDFKTTLQRLSSPSYEAPEDLDEILSDLGFLWAYWETCRYSKNFFAGSLAGVPEAGLDMALVKLGKQIGRFQVCTIIYGREFWRTKKSTETKKEMTDKRKVFVIAIYEYGKTIERGTKFNKACNMIQNQFEKWRGENGPWGIIPKDKKEMRTPSLDSIGRWLIETGIRDRDFKDEGGYWVKQT